MKKFLILFIFSFLVFPLAVLTLSKVEINTASLEQLDEIIGIGPALGQRIIDARPFSSVDDLLRVSGIGEKTLQKIKDQKLAYVENDAGTTEVATTEKTTGIEPTEEKPADVKPPLTYPMGIIINEILPSPEGPDDKNEWLELKNLNNTEIDISGWKIQDTIGSTKTYEFPKGTKIKALSFLVLTRPTSKITLNNDSDGLKLIQPNENIIDSVTYDKAPREQSYNHTGSDWVWSNTLTPDKTNILPQKTLPKETKTSYESSTEKQTAEAGRKSNPLTDTSSGFNVFLTAIILAVFSAAAALILKRKTASTRQFFNKD